jgi:gentisate 1,2-dioxygenase
MLLVNPHTGKLVDASDDAVDQLLRAGFKKQEPEVVEPEKDSAPVRRTRKPRK